MGRLLTKISGALLAVIFLSGCENEINLLAPHKEIPLVYCVLNQDDSLHIVRVQRSFAGEANALQMATIHDSVYYSNVQVELEQWTDRVLIDNFELQEYYGIIKDDGIFANNPHTLYATDISLNKWSQYKLKVYLPEIDMQLEASTFLVDKLTLIKPSYNQPALSFSDIDQTFEIEWRSAANARIYFLQFRFNYLEIFEEDTTKKEAYWSIAHFTSQNDLGGERMETLLQKKQFYRWMPSKIPAATEGIKRIIPKEALDIVFTIGGEELYTFIEVHNADQNPMVQKPVYTNISNGIGLFSARSQQEIKGKALTYASIDSVAHGQFTHQLGFVDTRDDYYRK